MADENDDDLGLGRNKMPKVAKVKNKMPAPVQITAEQLLREAKERELELVQPPPKQKISDEAELKDYQMRKRKKFEDNIRKNRSLITNWLAYASWEESQHNLRNARSVYERALDVDHRNRVIWLRYAEMEMKNRQINSARNVWDRAVSILPRADQLWFKYVYMEEKLGNIAGCRQVFERWMEWQPGEQPWMSYINFEIRCKELNRARIIYERFVCVHPLTKNWIKYAKFEEKNGYIDSARSIFERAGIYFGLEHIDETLFIAFAKFEEAQKEHERARAIYKKALEILPRDRCQEIIRLHTVHEKRFGDHAAIDNVIMSKRIHKYEEAVQNNGYDYDSWYQYIRVMENEGLEKAEQIRELYEKAIANKPPIEEKQHWRRYIYLWINYALFAELDLGDVSLTREIYKQCLANIPHERFTFAKIWIMFAEFEIRQKDIAAARKIMGHAVGRCPKDKLFREYIALEQQLVQFDRCRRLYEKFLEFSPENCRTWIDFALMEEYVDDIPRARAIFEMAISQPVLDMPEVLWKAYIDFELKQENYHEALVLHRRLLERTQHVQVWLSYAKTQMSMDSEDSTKKTREIFMEANRKLKACENKEDRKQLLEAWKTFESEFGNEKTKAEVERLQPTPVTRRRKCETESGAELWEEYKDYVFPDDEAAKPNLKLLSIAKSWKKEVESSVNKAASDDAGSSEEQSVRERSRNVEAGGEPLEYKDFDNSHKVPETYHHSSNEEDSNSSSYDGDQRPKKLSRRRSSSDDQQQQKQAGNERSDSNSEERPKRKRMKKALSDSADDARQKGNQSVQSHESDSNSDAEDEARQKRNDEESSQSDSDSEDEARQKQNQKGQLHQSKADSSLEDEARQKQSRKRQSHQSKFDASSEDEARRKLNDKQESSQSGSDSEDEARRKQSHKGQPHQSKSDSDSEDEARRKRSQKGQHRQSKTDSDSEDEARRKRSQKGQPRQSKSDSDSEDEARRKRNQKGQPRQSKSDSDSEDEARRKRSQKGQPRQFKADSNSEDETRRKRSKGRHSHHSDSDSEDEPQQKKKNFKRPASDSDDEQ